MGMCANVFRCVEVDNLVGHSYFGYIQMIRVIGPLVGAHVGVRKPFSKKPFCFVGRQVWSLNKKIRFILLGHDGSCGIGWIYQLGSGSATS